MSRSIRCARGWVERAEDWRWSSTRALLDPARGDGLTDAAPVLARAPDFAALLRSGEDDARAAALRRAESTGRPVGSSAFLGQVEAALGRHPAPRKRGPKANEEFSALSP